MRSFALLAVLALVPAPALAGSITHVSQPAEQTRSILFIGCPSCVQAEKPEPAPLAPGHEIVRIGHDEGKTLIYRTSNWLGGSPVTFVREANDAELAALKSRGIDVASTNPQPLAPVTLDKPTAIAARDGVDRKAKTASVTPRALDAASFALRLDSAQAAQ